ncbi:unnamed protein product (macronuclear) [Paramecium tetraurelia]|uniref:TLDc domain-containing protein n=1 Tax=Paramecium tetraurelia TaxID=5888 RepID=A0D2T8_PARTE|nr:uncharacterized protein GSPATT00012863001 [Paramecium tetraurelia]CAK77355.1 unnamed protein product [Paramecium tetraurelia]|eukprot:XP_001444752.1 hypothetical protein (macronuclear) [Paramecium tetraurelia strain d4-2]
MDEKEFQNRTCQQHSHQIIAVDLKLANTQNEKYLCGKCLILRIEGQQILLLTELIEMIKQMKNDQKKQFMENNQTQLSYMKQLQQSLKECNQHVKEKIEQTQNNIEIQIQDSNKDIKTKEEDQEEVDLDKDIESVSYYYNSNKEYELPQREQNINAISQLIENVQNQIGSISNAFQYQKILESLQNIKTQFQIEMPSDKDIKICEQHGLEIIMVNLEQGQQEHKRIACSKCIQEFSQKYTTLDDADENWTNFKINSKQMISKYSKNRESKFNQAVTFITNLRDKYQGTLTAIINDLETNRVITEKQLSPFPLYQKNIYQLDQNQLQEILEALSQKDLYRPLKLKLAQQDQLDSIFYHKLKETLENLVKYDLLTKEQIIMIEKNYEDFLILNEDEKQNVSNCNEIKQFLENTSLLQSYMAIVEESIQLYNNLQNQVDSLKEKGELTKLLNQKQPRKSIRKGEQTDQIKQSDLESLFQRQYSQFNQISKKYKELLILYKDENLISQLQGSLKKEINVQNQLKEKIQQLENQIQNLKQDFEKQKQQLEQSLAQNNESEKQLQAKLEQETQKLEHQKKKSEEQDQKFIQQIELLNKTITDVNAQIKNSLQSKDQQISSIQSQLQNSQNSLNKLQQTYNEVIKETKAKPSVLQDAHYQKILQTIEEKSKQVIKCSIPVYCGSKDGLNHTSFWNKVYGRKNLLMVFKSNTNYVCGAFSPCQWLQHIGNYVLDDTLQSFLFSQNHNQIYPLKAANKAYAIYCNSSYGPTFGSAHDLYIPSNFNSATSNLGSAYQCDQYGSITTSTHLFGQSSVQITECEIFEIVFK